MQLTVVWTLTTYVDQHKLPESLSGTYPYRTGVCRPYVVLNGRTGLSPHMPNALPAHLVCMQTQRLYPNSILTCSTHTYILTRLHAWVHAVGLVWVPTPDRLMVWSLTGFAIRHLAGLALRCTVRTATAATGSSARTTRPRISGVALPAHQSYCSGCTGTPRHMIQRATHLAWTAYPRTASMRREGQPARARHRR